MQSIADELSIPATMIEEIKKFKGYYGSGEKKQGSVYRSDESKW